MTGRFLAFGEIMLRLSSPGRELLLQSPRFDAWIAGAEANVATQLARLGHDVVFASAVPASELGDAAITALRGHGVDVRFIQRRGERIGLYFVTPGAGVRAPEVIYDRAYSSFVTAPAAAWDWDAMLAGIDRLHLSGITPALGPVPAEAAIAAAEAAAARGISLSFDGNWRAKLWDQRGGSPREILSRILAHADILFGNHRDIALLLDRPMAGEGEGEGEAHRRKASEAAFAAFPKLRLIASTVRHVEDADRHRLAARIDTPAAAVQTEEVVLSGIVDRIGAGDAFAAGVLHALHSGANIAGAAANGLALGALKHSLPGDAGLFRPADIDAFIAGGRDVRR
jgi:2-dehydro-3-deoxygluconokinase